MKMPAQFLSHIKIIIKAALFCSVFTGLLYLLSSILNFAPPHFARLVQGLIGIFAALLATMLFLKYDKRKFPDIGLKFSWNTLKNFFTGVFIGIFLMGFLAMCVVYISGLQVEWNHEHNILQFLLATIPLIPLALMEELGFRAYPLEIIKEKGGVRLAIITTSILFALYHIANGWSVSSSFYGPAIWGLVFGLAAIYSKGIALPTGIHYAANLTTSAFGEGKNAVSIWTVKYPVTAEARETDWALLFPVLALLAIAIFFIELYMWDMRSSQLH